MNTRTRSYVHNIIGGAHCVLVMLHHNNGVSKVAQPFKGGYKPVVIPLVKPYARFIEYIKHPHKG